MAFSSKDRLQRKALLFALLMLFDSCRSVSGQLSDPIAHDDNFVGSSNKFLQREASKDGTGLEAPDEEPSAGNTQCPKNTELRWMSEVSASIYSTPLIADINSDGRVEVVVPSFIHYLDVLEGVDGEKLPGWPAFHKSSVHSSPFLYDADKDGVREIGLATYNGEILFFRPNGEMLPAKLVVPRLKVHKDWYVGLDPDPVDHSKPDIGDTDSQPEQGANEVESVPSQEQAEQSATEGQAGEELRVEANGGVETKEIVELDSEQRTENLGREQRKEMDENELTEERNEEERKKEERNTGDGEEEETGLSSRLGEVGAAVDARLLREESTDESESKKAAVIAPPCDDDGCPATGHVPLNETEGGSKTEAKEGEGNGEAKAGKQRRRLLSLSEESLNTKEGGSKKKLLSLEGLEKRLEKLGQRRLLEEAKESTAEIEGQQLDAEAIETFKIFDKDAQEDETDDDPDDWDYDDFDFEHEEDMWSDEEWHESARESEKDSVFVDAHIVCSPVVADIDNDGRDELVVAASYFFDLEYYEDPAHASEVPEGIDLHKYIAGGIVAFDLFDMRVKWKVHLDLSTDSTQYRAYIYSHPTVVDLDRDGYMEILVGTSEGYLYCLSHVGYPRENFPIQMGEIQGQVIAADIDNDGFLEIVAVDTRGNVAAFDWRGRELWERHVASMISQGVSVGDVNGDGQPEVVFGTTSGHVYAVKGQSGTDIEHFPFRTHGRVMAPVLLVNLNPSRARGNGLDLVVTSFDGFVYMIEGESGCADVIDVGETAYSMVLAENVHGGPEMDLVVATMNGNVFCFQTAVLHHPLKAWPAQNHHRNAIFPRQNKGVFALPSSRQLRDVGGESFPVQFEVLDLGPMGSNYSVTISLMAPGHKTHQIKQSYSTPGVYTVRLPVPPVRTHAHVLLEMEDEHKLYFSDEFAVLFNMYFYRILKWISVLPLLATAVAVLSTKQGSQDRGAPLPTSLNMHQL